VPCVKSGGANQNSWSICAERLIEIKKKPQMIDRILLNINKFENGGHLSSLDAAQKTIL
jgi:hypothetical protein